jgi:hypothetical protein
MFTYDTQRTLVTDRHNRFTANARRRRLLGRRRQLDDTTPRGLERATTPVGAVGAARQPISLGRTPSEVEHRAA